MKKHLAVLCGVYVPEPSPTGLCVDRFVDLLKEEFDIDVLCLSVNGNEEQIVRSDGVRVFTLCGKRMAAEYAASGAYKTFLHLLGGAEIKTKLLGNLSWYRRAAFRQLEKLNENRPYDAVFSVCSPLAAHAAAVDFKAAHPAVRHAAYTVDPYSEKTRIRPFFCGVERLAKTERNLLAKADRLLLSEEVFTSRKDLFAEAEVLPYILPEAPLPPEIAEKDTIDCVYAGRFYRDIRHPEPMLKAFAAVTDPRIRLHLYSVGCEDVVNKYAEENEQIVLHGQVSHEEILEVYRNADVLVNVGNTTADFLPSKTFEYIATGKPILHFLNSKERCKPLDRYPLSLQVQKNSGTSVEGYILQMAGKAASYQEIAEIYHEHTKPIVKQRLLTALKG